MNDLVFTFNTKPFESAMTNIKGGLSSVTKNFKQFANTGKEKMASFFRDTKKGSEEVKKENQTSVKNFSDNSKSMIGALTKRVGALAAAYMSVRAAMKYIPEIGRAFQHAGDIMMRSLFWPIRKVLIPLLQKMLDWVREHRIMFVRWGVNIANAFRVVITVVKGVIGLVKTFVNSFIGRFEAIFGKVTKSMGDIANIVMFKITVVAQYLIALLQPVFSMLGDMFAKGIENVANFFQGFAEGFGETAPMFKDFENSLSRILTLFDRITMKGGVMTQMIKDFGTVSGQILKLAVSGFGQLLDSLISAIEGSIVSIDYWKAWYNDDVKKMEVLKKEHDALIKEHDKRATERWTEQPERSTREVKEKTPRFISPAKETKAKNIKIENNIKVEGVNVNVRTEGDGERIGRAVGKGINDTLHGQIKQNITNAVMGVASP